MTGGFRNFAAVSLFFALVLVGCTDSPGTGQGSRGSGAIARPQDASAVPVVIAKVERTHNSRRVTRHWHRARRSRPSRWNRRSPASSRKCITSRGSSFARATCWSRLTKVLFLPPSRRLKRRSPGTKRRPSSIRRSCSAMTNSTRKALSPRSSTINIRPPQRPPKPPSRADEAAIQTAKIQLSYCSIYAPISGVTGAQLVYPGATVKANDAPDAGRYQPGFTDLRQFRRSPAVSGVDQDTSWRIPACPFRPRRPATLLPKTVF